jgi:hypothetical protein
MLRAGPVDAEAFRLKNWQLQGSSDGLEWVVLHNHEGRRHSTTLAGEKRKTRFTVSSSLLHCFPDPCPEPVAANHRVSWRHQTLTSRAVCFALFSLVSLLSGHYEAGSWEVDGPFDPENDPAVTICDGYFSWFRIVSLDPVFLCLSGLELYGTLDRRRV